MSAGRTLPPCDKDCEHCQFQDCIWDGLDYEDYKELAALDKDLTRTPEQKKVAAQQRAYYEANREKLAAQKRAYREANREKRNLRETGAMEPV